MRTRMTVSLLRHNSNYGGCNQEKQHLKRSVCLRKTDSDVADVTRSVANGPKISVLGGHFVEIYKILFWDLQKEHPCAKRCHLSY